MSTQTQPVLPAPNRERRPPDEVMAEVTARVPHLVEHMFADRDWIWYCGPSLQGEHNKATREELKQIGFRFSPKGHVMQDAETRGSWSHSCTRPLPRWHGAANRKAHGKKEPDQPAAQDYAKLFAELGL
jgi:hypothetical protein